MGGKRVETAEVPGNRVVVEPPLNHGTKPSASLINRPVHASLQLHFDRVQLAPHTLGDRFAFDGERSLPGRPAVVREAQEVKSLRPPLSPFFTPFRRVAAELDQTGFVRMKLEAELLEPLLQVAEEAFGVTAVLESHDEIVGIADDNHRSACVTISPLLCPKIEDVMQKHVRKDR